MKDDSHYLSDSLRLLIREHVLDVSQCIPSTIVPKARQVKLP